MSQSLRFTQTKEVMLVMNKLTMTNELGNARKPVTMVSKRIDKLQYMANTPVINCVT